MAPSGKYQPRPQPGSDDETGTSRNADKAARREAARLELLRAQAAESRRKRLRSALAIVVAIAAIVAVVVVVELTKGGSGNTAAPSSALDPQVAKEVTSIPASVYDAVGNGGGAVKAKPNPVQAPALTSDGKPRILYVGAEYCPFCAAERWAVVAALSRFGAFSHLGQTTSSASDVYPNTATLSFHGATYTSPYLSFTGVEQTTNQPDGNGGYTPLDSLAPADQTILNTYDTTKYAGSNGGIPFIDFGGKFVSSGASYDPAVLQKLSHQQIAADLSNPTSPVAKAIVGTANTLTADLCTLTGQKPAAVCTSAGVRAAAS